MKSLESLLPTLRQPLGLAVGLGLGAGLFFPVSFCERLLGSGILASVLVEEGLKLALFLLLEAAALREPRGRESLYRYPLYAITGFATVENLAYLLRAPTSSIYERLLFAFPIHLNTGLCFALAFLPGRPSLYPAFFLLSLAYHFGLNTLALVLAGTPVLAVGAGNLALTFFLFLKLRAMLIERSLEHAGSPNE